MANKYTWEITKPIDNDLLCKYWITIFCNNTLINDSWRASQFTARRFVKSAIKKHVKNLLQKNQIIEEGTYNV
jgi:hypothetical protein